MAPRVRLENFSFEFLLDLKKDHAVFDLNEARTILGPIDSKICSGTDLLLRYTNLEDRVSLIEQLGRLFEYPDSINQGIREINYFYRWQVPFQPLKVLEVRAIFLEQGSLLEGIIIDQTVNKDRLFPLLTTESLALSRDETYFIFNAKGEELSSTLVPNDLVQYVKDFLVTDLPLLQTTSYSLHRFILHSETTPTTDPTILCVKHGKENPSLANYELILDLQELLAKHKAA